MGVLLCFIFGGEFSPLGHLKRKSNATCTKDFCEKKLPEEFPSPALEIAIDNTFSMSSLTCSQIWLNPLVDDHRFASMARAELPITDHYSITEHFTSLDLHHLCFIWSDLKCYGSATSTFRNHPTYKAQFFSFLFFSSLDPSYFQNF